MQLSMDTQLSELTSEFNLSPWGELLCKWGQRRWHKVEDIRVVGNSKVLQKQLSGPGYDLGARSMGLGSRTQGILPWLLGTGPSKKPECRLWTQPTLQWAGPAEAKLSGRMGSRTWWWYQTLMRKEKSTLTLSTSPSCSYSTVLSSSLDTLLYPLFTVLLLARFLCSHLVGLSLILTFPYSLHATEPREGYWILGDPWDTVLPPAPSQHLSKYCRIQIG